MYSEDGRGHLWPVGALAPASGVMQLLGMNVADARRSCAPGGRWDEAVMRHIGQHMLNAIAGMHKLGYIHRDIKPANFAITSRHATPSEGWARGRPSCYKVGKNSRDRHKYARV